MTNFKKKVLAFALAGSIVLSSTGLVFAAPARPTDPLQHLFTHEVLKGTSGNWADLDANRNTGMQRYQAAIMQLKFMGKAEEADAFAQAYTGQTPNFADANSSISKYVLGIMGYLKAHPELGIVGYPDGTFKPYDPITGHEYASIMLNALEVDADWAAVPQKAKELGLVYNNNDNLVGKSQINYDQIANLTYDLLAKEVEPGKSFGEKVGMKVVDLAKELEVNKVSVIAANEIKVEFNQPVDTSKAKFELKGGYIAEDITVTFNSAKDTAIISTEYNMEGDYTVEVNGLELKTKAFDVKVEAQKLASFTIKTGMLTALESQAVKYTALDQYGNEFEVPSTAFTATAHNISEGTPVTIVGNGNEFKITTDLSEKLEKKVIVTLVHNSTTTMQSKTYTIEKAAGADSVTLTTPQPKEKEARIYSDKEGYTLPIKIVDQYGEEMSIDTLGLDKPEAERPVMFISSNAAIINPADFTIEDDKLMFKTGSATGNVKITAIVKASAKSASVSFDVNADAALKTVSFRQPTGLIVAKEAITVEYTAKDTYNADRQLSNLSDLVWFSSNPAIVDVTQDISLENGVLKITPTKDGNVTISAFLNGEKQGDINMNVRAEAVATKITKLADGTPVFFSKDSGTHTYTKADFVVVDQYNRVIKSDDLAGSVAVAVKGTNTNVTAAGAVITGNAAGEATLIGTYTDGSISLTREFKVTVVEDSKVVNYKLAAMDNKNMYTANVADDVYNTKTIAIEFGIDANGNHVALSAADKADFTVTSSNNGITVDGAIIRSTRDNRESGSTVVAVWKKGQKISEITFTLSNAAPKVTTMAFDESSIKVAKTHTHNVADHFETIKDQYGATMALPAGTWFSSNTAIATVNQLGVVTGVAEGKANITFVTTNGVNVVIEVVVE